MNETKPSRSVSVVSRLAAIRRTVHRRLVAYGVCAVLAGGCLSFVTVIALDWLLDLPSWLRVVGAALFVAGFGLAVLHWIIKPLQTHFSLLQVAGQLERYFPGLSDRLSSTVNFAVTLDDRNDPLVGSVLAETDRITREMPLDRVLTRRPLLTQVALLVAACIALTSLVWRSPHWVEVGMARYTRPFSNVDWPRRVSIEPLTEDVRVPVGEPATLAMKIVRGAQPHLRGTVHLRYGDGSESVLAMGGDGDTYVCQVPSVTEDIAYWFEAGDADTRARASRIHVVRRPTVVSAVAQVHPPRYAERDESRSFDLTNAPAIAPAGAVVDVAIRASKPVSLDRDGHADAWIERESGERLDLVSSPRDPRRLTATLTADASELIAVRLMDRDGFANRGAAQYRLVVEPDRPPKIVLHAPRTTQEVTAKGSVTVLARIEDDFGVSDVRMIGDVAPHGDAGVQRAIDLALMDQTTSIEFPTGVARSLALAWSMQDLAVEPPADIRVQLYASDNRRTERLGEQTGQSPVIHVKVVGEPAFLQHMRDDLSRMRALVRRAGIEQLALADRTRRRHEDAENADGSPAAPTGDVAQLADKQHWLRRRVEQLGGRFADVADRLRRNRAGSAEWAAQIDRAGATARRIAGQTMRASENMLADLEGSDEATRRATLDRVYERQTAAAESLQRLLDELDQWRGLQDLVAKVQDLMDRQAQLQQETTALSPETIGRKPDDLASNVQMRLTDMQRRQRQMAHETERMIARMRDGRSAEGGSESGGDNSVGDLEDALRTAVAHEIAEHMSSAADAIGENRLSGAGLEQRSAAEGLARVLEGFKQGADRRLAVLAKRLNTALITAKYLLEQQQLLLAATREAVDLPTTEESIQRLGDDQTRVWRNAESFATSV